MDRRDFLRFSGLASAGIMYPTLAPPALAQSTSGASWRTFEVTTRVELLKPAGVTRGWVPVPLTEDSSYEKSLGNAYEAEGGSTAYAVDSRYGAGMVSAETDGAVKDLSYEATKGAKTDVEKARALYEWIVDNTHRDPKTRGCGTGDIKFMVENKAWGGKCADLNALFVALARAQGIPARDVYGIRVADSALGYKSLGKSGDITKAQHCRAEIYLNGYGWVPMDPADVRKVILEEGGGKAIDDPMVVAARKRLFGSWEMNWLAYNYANDVSLPGSTRGKVAFLMYPQAETAEGRLDPLDPDNFKYQITSREIT